MYADRKGWPLESVEVGLRLTGGAGAMTIDRTLTIAGLDEDQRARLADIAERTPVTPTLKNGPPIPTRLISQADAPARPPPRPPTGQDIGRCGGGGNRRAAGEERSGSYWGLPGGPVTLK